MCKNCTCKKTIDFSEMAKQLLGEFYSVMPIECILFLDDIKEKKPIKNLYKSSSHYLKTKYPLA